ncbi:MAG: DUF4149 domain-containing protein [Nitrospirota bacterium]
MPNFYFMGVQFFHLMALAIWVGGMVIIMFIAAPAIFKRLESRTLAGEITGEILRKFDIIVFFCISALVITGIIKYLNWENPTPWIIMRYMAILVMSLSAIYSSGIISPKMRSLKSKISSFDTLPENNHNRIAFNQLHRISSICMFLNLICGIISILLA